MPATITVTAAGLDAKYESDYALQIASLCNTISSQINSSSSKSGSVSIVTNLSDSTRQYRALRDIQAGLEAAGFIVTAAQLDYKPQPSNPPIEPFRERKGKPDRGLGNAMSIDLYAQVPDAAGPQSAYLNFWYRTPAEVPV